MQTRRLGLAIVALAAMGPTISQAWPGPTPLDACVNAFEKTLVSPDDVRHKFTVVHGRDDAMSALTQYYSLGYTFDLQANDPKTGVVVAQARCMADSRGRITSLSSLPLVAPSQGTKRVAKN